MFRLASYSLRFPRFFSRHRQQGSQAGSNIPGQLGHFGNLEWQAVSKCFNWRWLFVQVISVIFFFFNPSLIKSIKTLFCEVIKGTLAGAGRCWSQNVFSFRPSSFLTSRQTAASHPLRVGWSAQWSSAFTTTWLQVAKMGKSSRRGSLRKEGRAAILNREEGPFPM